jgi:hypothetical protein
VPVIKPKKNCKWCQHLKEHPNLVKRIYKSAHYVKGGEPLKNIARDQKMQYPALINHCKYHQGLTDDEMAAAKLERLARRTSNAIINRNIKTVDARQQAIDMMFQKLMSGDFDDKMTIKDFLTALKHADDTAAKRTDTAIDVMRMMHGVRSGEVSTPRTTPPREFNPWDEEETPVVEGEVVDTQSLDARFKREQARGRAEDESRSA